MNAKKTSLYSANSAQLAALDNLSVPTLIATREGSLQYANKAARHLLTYGSSISHPLSGQELFNRLDLSQTKQLKQACERFCDGQLSLTFFYGEHQKRIQIFLTPLPTSNLAEELLQITLKDVTQYEAAQHLPVHFHQAMQQTEDMVMVTDCHGSIEYVNPAFLSQTGYSEAEVIGNNPRLLSSDEHNKAFYAQMWKTLRAGESFRNIFINRRRNGERYHEEKTITPIRDGNGQISHFVATGRDITDLINSEQRLNYLRRFDTMTGLPNRQRLSEQFEQHVMQRRKTPMALFLVDLDRLSRINDSLGRTAGDELLRQTANRLRKALPLHFVGRLGSDAFMVLAEEIQTPDQAAHLAQKIQQIMALPFELTQAELFMSVSLGITLYPYDGDQFDELVNKADSAMHRCKEHDQHFGFFTEDLTLQTQRRVQLENQLRQALLHKEFHLVFQPRVDLATGQINSAEVLLRWIKADGKMISPGEFIPVLEEMGLITSVGEWVLMRACVYASQWQKHGHRMRISVNLSARQLRQPNLPAIVERCLESSGLAPDLLELELTETSMLEDVEHSIAILSQLREKGIRIAIDDFGTGYSSLAYLKKLPADTLKIDQAFVQELDGDDPSDRNIVQTIIQLAHNFNLSVTAEGIETEEQLAIIRELGCNEAQGFLLAKPMNETELLRTKRHFEEQACLFQQAQLID